MPEEPARELAAMTLTAAAIHGSGANLQLAYSTENLPVAKRIVRIVRDCFGAQARVETSRAITRNARTVIVDDAGPLLEKLGLNADALRGTESFQVPDEDGARIAILRGAFLAGGSVSNPRKNYHLEIVTDSEPFAVLLRNILDGFAIRSNVVPRRERFVLYLNKGDGIAALLALIGAHASILNLENVRILKETRNNVNRAVNCETANINKTVNAAQTQMDSIRRIERDMGLGRLSAPLREAAELRLEHPEASLQELCELCGTTKSGMNHRLRKINAIARALSEEV